MFALVASQISRVFKWKLPDKAEREGKKNADPSSSLALANWFIKNSLGQNTGVGSHALLQGTFPTQGSNTGLPHCRRILDQLSPYEEEYFKNFDDLGLTCFHGPMSRAARHSSQYLRCQRVLDYDASNRCQWRLNSAGISNRISIAFDNAWLRICVFLGFSLS